MNRPPTIYCGRLCGCPACIERVEGNIDRQMATLPEPARLALLLKKAGIPTPPPPVVPGPTTDPPLSVRLDLATPPAKGHEQALKHVHRGG